MFDLVERTPLVRRGPALTLVVVIAGFLLVTHHVAAAAVLLVGGALLVVAVTLVVDYHRNRAAQSWPLAQAVVESVSVAMAGGGEFQQRSYIAELAYSYKTAVGYFAGIQQRSFGTEAEAWTFADQIKGKEVSVRYDPRDTEASDLPESELLAVLPEASNLGRRIPWGLVGVD